MKRHNYLAATALMLMSTPALAGCGSDDEALTRAQFTGQANAICLDADAKIGEVLGPIFGGEPTPAERQDALDAIISTSRDTSGQLANLSSPSEIADEVDDMIAAFDAANDEAEAQGLGFFETDDDPWAPVGVIAGELGLDDCAGG